MLFRVGVNTTQWHHYNKTYMKGITTINCSDDLAALLVQIASKLPSSAVEQMPLQISTVKQFHHQHVLQQTHILNTQHHSWTLQLLSYLFDVVRKMYVHACRPIGYTLTFCKAVYIGIMAELASNVSSSMQSIYTISRTNPWINSHVYALLLSQLNMVAITC